MSSIVALELPDDLVKFLEANSKTVTKSELVIKAMVSYYCIPGFTDPHGGAPLRERRSEHRKPSGALKEAQDLLNDLLRAGQRSAEDVKAIAEMFGIPQGTLRRAKTSLGVRSVKSGFGGATGGEDRWYWRLKT